MAGESKQKDIWDKLDVIGKLIAGIAVAGIGLWINNTIQTQAENNRKAQLYTTIISEREKADGEIRAEMFKSLLDLYAKGGAKEEMEKGEGFQDRIMLLNLLIKNFDEYFNARPLFERLYHQLKDSEANAHNNGIPDSDQTNWIVLKDTLQKIVQEVSYKQALLLARVGILQEEISVPVGGQTRFIPLYDIEGLEGLSEKDFFLGGKRLIGTDSEGKDETQQRDHYSIKINVTKALENSANIEVYVFRDLFDGKKYVSSRLIQGLPVEVSIFDTPYMDNSRLFSGDRFSILYRGSAPISTNEKSLKATFSVITFEEKFLSLRDRPFFESMVDKIRK
jgi:hypothetical protein